MAKTLQQLLIEEMGSADPDKAESLADVVLDWVQRIERHSEVHMTSGWREVVEVVRKQENEEGVGK